MADIATITVDKNKLDRALKSLMIKPKLQKSVSGTFSLIGRTLIEDVVTHILSDPKSGRTYSRRIGNTTVTKRASATGEYPQNWTGGYIRGLTSVQNSNYLIFGNKAEYAGWLEVGTTTMGARRPMGQTRDSFSSYVTIRLGVDLFDVFKKELRG